MHLRHARTRRTAVAVLVAAFALVSWNCDDIPDEPNGDGDENISVQELGDFIAEAFAALPLILADGLSRLIAVGGGDPVPGVTFNDNGDGTFDGAVEFDIDGDGEFDSNIDFDAAVTLTPTGEFLGAIVGLSGSGPGVSGSGSFNVAVLGGGALPILSITGDATIRTGSDVLQAGSLLVISITSFSIQAEPVGESVLLFGGFSFSVDGIEGFVLFDTDENTGAQTITVSGTANGEDFEFTL